MESLHADLPYPSLDGIGKDLMAVRIISPAYADRESEMTAVLQYVFQAFVFNSKGMENFAHTLHRIAVSEMTHLDILGSLICKLGALPVFTSCPPRKFDFYTTAAVSYACEPETMLLCDIRGENEAIRGYEKMLCKLQSEQIRAVIARIIEDEKLHLQALETMLAELRAEK